MADSDQQQTASEMGPWIKSALAVVAISGGAVAMYYAMKKISQIHEKNELMVELLKKNNKLLSDLVTETKKVLTAISDITIIQNKQLIKIEECNLLGLPSILNKVITNLDSIIRPLKGLTRLI